ncbi:hypothetical protein Aduo_015581 [Ancylostoma duodenale]
MFLFSELLLEFQERIPTGLVREEQSTAAFEEHPEQADVVGVGQEQVGVSTEEVSCICRLPKAVAILHAECCRRTTDFTGHGQRPIPFPATGKVRAKSSTKAEIERYLPSTGVEVAAQCKKADLLEELNNFIASRGRVAALRNYTVEAICAELGGYLTKVGKPGDALTTVNCRLVYNVMAHVLGN